MHKGPWPSLVWTLLAQQKNWVIGSIFSITTRCASALAVVFFRLLEPLSYVRFDILKLMQVSLIAYRSVVPKLGVNYPPGNLQFVDG